MKIRHKLTLLFTAIVASILFIFCLTVFYFYSLNRETDFYDRLKDKAIKTSELLSEVNEINSEILQIVDRHDITTLFSEEIMMYNDSLRLIYKSGEEYIHFPNSVLKGIVRKKEIRFKTGDRETFGIFLTNSKESLIVICSAIDKYGYSKQNYLIVILASGWFISVLIIFFAGRYFSYNALKPITEVIKQVDMISATNLDVRVSTGANRDEIYALASTFNKMLRRLQEAFIVQKNFVSNASHELRTPLTAIKGQIEVSLMKGRDEKEYKEILVSILEDVTRLTKISNGLLELAKMSSDGQQIIYADIRIDELIWELRSSFLKDHADCHVKVDFENFPDEESQLHLKCSPNLIRTAFLNLIDNGCKYSPNRTAEVLVIFMKDKLKLLFLDNGIGIPKDDLVHIFQPFYRSNRTKSIKGYGIGLSIVQKIIILHQGTIEVNSNEGKGTIFTITLPRV